ncbi:MAG TPA: hypothetical protein VHE53_04540 [Patescibacteria group bacterium]|nr:hypothetical protein [Patescibacteria group bacterium]
MRTQRKFFRFLYYFFTAALLLIITIFIIPPESKITVFDVGFGAPILLLTFLALTLFFLFTFVFANIRRGILTSAFITGIFFLRLFGIRSIYQVIILLIIALLIEYLYKRGQA